MQDVQVVVITQQSGQAPEEVERAVSLPIERALAGTPGVTTMRSVSITGLSVVTLIFADGTDDYFARSQMLEKLRDADLPAGVVPSLAPLSTAVGEVYRYILEKPADMPLYEARAIHDFVIRPALRMVLGVADVTCRGGSVKQYQIRVTPDTLKRYQVTLADIETAVGNANSNAGGGIMRCGDESVVIRGIGLYQSVDDVANTVVKAQGGRTVRIGDLGDVVIGTPERGGIVSFDHEADVAEGVVVGAGLVSLILLLFLRNWRAALAVAAIIPLALLAAFAGLYAVGVPANLISMGAVDFGIIIDSAVVLVESMMVALAVAAVDHGGSNNRLQSRSVLRGTVSSLAKPIVFSKAIIFTAFIPIFTFQRVEGKLFSPVALTLSFALGAALVLTLTFLPAVLSMLIERYDIAERHLPWMDRLRDAYRRLLHRARGSDRRMFIFAIAALVVTGALVPQLGSEFLPELDEGNIWLTIQLAPSAAIETTRGVEAKVRAIMLSYPEVAHVISETGRPDDATDSKGPSSLQMLIDLKPRDEWRADFPTKAALGLAGLHMSVSAAVGFIAVAGIAVQNGVVMLEHITERTAGGDDRETAIIEGAIDRLRPIIMTALMAGLGLLPAALSTGIGSETQRPFACVIVGGVVSATLFMLLLPLALRRLQHDDPSQSPAPDTAAQPA